MPSATMLFRGTVTVLKQLRTHQAASGTYHRLWIGQLVSYHDGGSTGPATTGSGGGHTHTATLSGNTE